MLTENGRNLLMRYLANLSPGFVREIAVGIGNSTTTLDSNRLDFEVARVTVVTGSISGSTSEILYHGSLPSSDAYTIKEIGLFPVATSVAGVPLRGALLTTFEPGDGSVFDDPVPPSAGLESQYILKTNTSLAAGAAGIRIGNNAAYIRPGSSVSFPSGGDFSQYGPNDLINVALASGSSSYNLAVEIFDSLGNSKIINMSGTANAEGSYFYDIKASSIGIQTIDFSNLSQIQITNNSSSYVILDGLRFEEVDTANPLNSMVARQPVSIAKDKLDGFSMDLEYRLTVDWGA